MRHGLKSAVLGLIFLGFGTFAASAATISSQLIPSAETIVPFKPFNVVVELLIDPTAGATNSRFLGGILYIQAPTKAHFVDIPASGGAITAVIESILLPLAREYSIFYSYSADIVETFGDIQTFSTITGNGNASLTAVPGPAALPLLFAGLGALGLLGWRKRRSAAHPAISVV
ncbi:MAG: hypothetical protein ACO1OG_01915 [Devosia sp.]